MIERKFNLVKNGKVVGNVMLAADKLVTDHNDSVYLITGITRLALFRTCSGVTLQEITAEEPQANNRSGQHDS
jgi:hypothetical protein